MAAVRYSERKVQEHFEEGTHSCAICFRELAGRECHQLTLCAHVYCLACLGGYFEAKVGEGAVRDIPCPDPSCGHHVLPTEIRRAVDGKLYERYERLLLQSALDAMADVVYCPRPHCQHAVVLEAEGQTLGECASCGFNFCTLCERAWHLGGCKVVDLAGIVAEYKETDAAGRAALERRYAGLKQAVINFESEAYLKKYTKPCPSCGMSISKIDGCNKMVCGRCHAKFCWLCCKTIKNDNPYEHFRSGACSGRLMDGVEVQQQHEWEDEARWYGQEEGALPEDILGDDGFGWLNLFEGFEL